MIIAHSITVAVDGIWNLIINGYVHKEAELWFNMKMSYQFNQFLYRLGSIFILNQGPGLVLYAICEPKQFRNMINYMTICMFNYKSMIPVAPFYWHGIPLISNYFYHKVWDEITYHFLNFNGCTVEVYEWVSNFISHISGHVVTYLCGY